jgi:hypothetical protein
MKIVEITITFEGDEPSDEQYELLESRLESLEDHMEYQCKKLINDIKEEIPTLSFNIDW